MAQAGLGGGREQDRRFKGVRMATADVTMPPFTADLGSWTTCGGRESMAGSSKETDQRGSEIKLLKEPSRH